jgi:hypothetical protein
MKRIAAPMVGGMISSTALTLMVIPAIYAVWRERGLRDAPRRGALETSPSVLATNGLVIAAPFHREIGG